MDVEEALWARDRAACLGENIKISPGNTSYDRQMLKMEMDGDAMRLHLPRFGQRFPISLTVVV